MNEEKNVDIKNESTGNYITGIFGAIIGGAIATIPWIFVYIKMNYILSLLAMIISFGALKGYEICKGKMSKGVKLIITVVSLILVVIATLFVLPQLLAWQNNKPVEMLYESTEFMNALYRDLAMSVFFAILGITASYPYINKKLMDHGVQVVDPEICTKQEEIKKIELNNKLKPQAKEEIKLIKSAFEKYNAFSKETAVPKNDIISEMNNSKLEKIFKKFKKKNIILKSGNNYYYNENNEFNLLKSDPKSVLIVTFSIIAICMVMSLVFNFLDSTSQKNNNPNSSTNLNTYHEYSIRNNTFSFSIPDSWIEQPTVYSNTTQLIDDTISGGSINIIPTKKSELDNYSLNYYANTILKDYMYSAYAEYNPEANSNVEKIKIGNYDVYYIKLDSTSENVCMTGYWLETENYFVEIYGVSLKTTFSTNKTIFETAVSSFKEIQ